MGISPIPSKTCNYSCVYCQLGRTNNLTNRRQEFFPLQGIIDEFRHIQDQGIHYDVVTIVGEGEPTLYLKLGKLIRELKKMTSKPIAVITNGALLSDPQVREELMAADIVLPSLDAYDEKSYHIINRPYGTLKFTEVIEGLQLFSKQFCGHLWIEIMLIRGMNDSPENLLQLKRLLKTIRYDRLYINAPVRPPAEDGIEEPDGETIMYAVDVLGGIAINMLVSEGFYSPDAEDYDAVISIVKRHPMTQFEISSFLSSRGCSDIDRIFEQLRSDPGVAVILYKGYETFRIRI